MTVPIERTNAVVNTEMFLMQLIDPKQTPRIPKEIRKRASSLLRHYPTKGCMEIIAEREDTQDTSPKIFGRGFK